MWNDRSEQPLSHSALIPAALPSSYLWSLHSLSKVHPRVGNGPTLSRVSYPLESIHLPRRTEVIVILPDWNSDWSICRLRAKFENIFFSYDYIYIYIWKVGIYTIEFRLNGRIYRYRRRFEKIRAYPLLILDSRQIRIPDISNHCVFFFKVSWHETYERFVLGFVSFSSSSSSFSSSSSLPPLSCNDDT